MQYPDGSLFADIGTRRGNSALALSLNPKVHVDSYDIHDQGAGNKIKKDNIDFHLKNVFDDLSQVLKYDLILLDIDPHAGSLETRLIEYLRDENWQGVLLLDDIGPDWKALHEMWNNVQGLIKYDLTVLAHTSGTGLIDYGENVRVEL